MASELNLFSDRLRCTRHVFFSSEAKKVSISDELPLRIIPLDDKSNRLREKALCFNRDTSSNQASPKWSPVDERSKVSSRVFHPCVRFLRPLTWSARCNCTKVRNTWMVCVASASRLRERSSCSTAQPESWSKITSKSLAQRESLSPFPLKSMA